MRYLVVLIVWIAASLANAQNWEDQRTFSSASPDQTLRVISSTDTSFFVPIVESFLGTRPDASIEYLVTGTADIDRIFRSAPQEYDVVISSAMDLQLKLANDGYARQLDDVAHPEWAHWRQSLFGFTSEPAAIVLNRAAFDGHPLPRSRQDLIEALRARPDVFEGRIGTYDVRASGLGYLFATQDARASETYWRLTEVMGSLKARLYCCSGDMIDDLAAGKIAMAYNVLGSYAQARKDVEDDIAIILPSDFPTTMMRTAFVSAQTSRPDLAEAFVRHLIRLQAENDATAFPLPPLVAELNSAARSTIALEPALMTHLDTLKKRKFLAEWESAVIQQD